MNIPLRKWIENFKNDVYISFDRKTQCDAGWYDWFCRNSSLRNKTYKMGKIIRQIENGGKIDLDKTYVFFKNNCPCEGPLYDDFRICSLETGDVQFTITIDDKREKNKYSVFGKDKKGKEHWEIPIFATDYSRELVKWLNSPWKNEIRNK